MKGMSNTSQMTHFCLINSKYISYEQLIRSNIQKGIDYSQQITQFAADYSGENIGLEGGRSLPSWDREEWKICQKSNCFPECYIKSENRIPMQSLSPKISGISSYLSQNFPNFPYLSSSFLLPLLLPPYSRPFFSPRQPAPISKYNLYQSKMGPKKPKKQQQPDDEFLKMIAPQLQANLKLYKQKTAQIKSKRNYIQMDRDMVQQFYHNTQLQIEQTKTQILNKQTQGENMQLSHNTEVKVFLQKLKLLEYEQEKANMNIEKDGEDAKVKENRYYEDRMKDMKKKKQDLKKDLVDDEKKHIEKTEITEQDHKRKEAFMVEGHDNQLFEIEKDYEAKLARMKEELELKERVEIHELEERKNLHINELMKNHEQAFAELKNYYNEITRDNLKLIKEHKAEIKRINEESEKNKKKIFELRNSNNELKDPLKKDGLERDKLKSLLRQFEKHKMSRENYKSKLVTIREKVIKIEKEFAELGEKYEQVVMDRKDLKNKFDKLTSEVKRHAEMDNVVLSRKLQTQLEQLQQKEAQLHQLMQNSALQPKLVEQIKGKVKDSIENKNLTIKNLKYSIHHATKAYNDAIRVYEAKLVQFGIPAEQLGFQPLQTITSTMPAGLVSS